MAVFVVCWVMDIDSADFETHNLLIHRRVKFVGVKIIWGDLIIVINQFAPLPLGFCLDVLA